MLSRSIRVWTRAAVPSSTQHRAISLAVSSLKALASYSRPTAKQQTRTLERIQKRTMCLCHSTAAGADPIPGGLTPSDGQDTQHRLPTTAKPTHYELVFRTDLDTKWFAGEGYVHLDILEDSKSLTFNLHPTLKVTHVALSSTSLKSESFTSLPLSALELDADRERATLAVPETLTKGTQGVKVWMRWEAELGGSMLGYYRSEGDEVAGGQRQVYALTQMEPTAARRAFPCWDEPLLKATFDISLISKDGLTSLSNMPATSSRPWKPTNTSAESAGKSGYELGSMLSTLSTSSEAGKTKTESSDGTSWNITKFETTPMVSTYLVAWANGEFKKLETTFESKLSKKTIPLTIYSTPELIHQAEFALDVKKKVLPVYEDIFDVAFPLPKLDTLVAHDFDAGAMENWGLITGRTTVFLFDPKKSSLAAKKRVATVQSHEVAHMWFGNVVTMAWWDNLWLNESFATLMGEVIVPDRVFPEWKVRAEFLTTHLASALALDSQRSSHPIEVDCPDANQINQIFDSISYSKGGSVLRMLASVVGEETFLKGVSIYLKKRLFGNSVTKDLWDGISEASGLDVAAIMKNWTLKIGFPVITVKEDGGKITVTQNRFLATGDVKPEEDETLWYVPLEIKTVDANGKATVDHKAVLSDRESTYDLKGSKSFKLNAETVGVYRVAYSPERLAILGEEASKGYYSTEDRVGLVSDAFTLARAGSGKTSGGLNLISKLGNEEEYLVWSTIGAGIAKISATWWEQPEAVRDALDKLRVELFKPIVQKMGYEHHENDEPSTKELRELAVSTCAAAKDADVLAELKRRFAPFLENGDDSQIPPDLQRSIYTNAVRHGGDAEYNKIRAVYDKPPNPSTKVDAMFALCATQDEKNQKKTFDMIADGSVKEQDVFYFFAGLAGNRLTRRKMAEYFRSEYEALAKRFNDNFGFNHLVKYSFNSLTTKKDFEETRAFFEGKDTKKFKSALAQTLDAIEASASWLERDQKDVEEWLKEKKYL